MHSVAHRCQICGTQTGCCKHTESRTKRWGDERHLQDIGEITNPARLLSPPKESTMSLQTTPKFVMCELCYCDVRGDYLTKHILRHAKNNYVSDDWVITTRPSESDDHSVIEKKDPPSLPVVPPDPIDEQSVKDFLNILPPVKLNPYENFVFRRVRGVSFSSSKSKNGKYSDFSICVWFPETISSHNSAWTGGTWSNTLKVSSRLQMNIVHDSQDDYYTFSGKVYKKNGTSDIEVEDGYVPFRVCLQEDLMKEIMNCLLYFRVNPLTVYRLFRRAARKPILPSKTNPLILQSENLEELQVHKPVANVKKEEVIDSDEDGWDWGRSYMC